ncbi:hypothetical protein [Fibrella forsythiae]|uniref:Helix-turn-helix domain-containing protein n=1 Tax=Fibrella forsythiae TaxID=2817061 RepID=A0ABS3JBH9_9BACT|nr:hypothetical protein [Fibrella forsythiae]MBO0947345.1 hypothetical protein [Fibrella forsythiae]
MHATQKFEPAQTHLYTCLLHLFSKKGNGTVWPASLRLENDELCKAVGLSLNTLKSARLVLVSRGVIGFDGEAKGRGVRPEYWLFDEHGQTKKVSKSDTLSPKKVSDFDSLMPEKVSKSDTFRFKRCQILTVYTAERCQILTPCPYIRDNKETFILSLKGVCEALRGLSVEAKKNEVVEVLAEEVIPQLPSRPVRGDPFTLRSRMEGRVIPFSRWFETYGHQAQEKQARALWELFDDQTLQTIWTHTQAFVQVTEKQYRPLPANYLSQEVFHDEIIDRNANATTSRRNRRHNGDQGNTGEELDQLIDGYYSS